jgi:hypothetical protein
VLLLNTCRKVRLAQEYVHRASKASMCVTCIGRAREARKRTRMMKEKRLSLVAFYRAYCSRDRQLRTIASAEHGAGSLGATRFPTHLLGVLCSLPVVPAAIGAVLLGLIHASVSTLRPSESFRSKDALGFQGGRRGQDSRWRTRVGPQG